MTQYLGYRKPYFRQIFFLQKFRLTLDLINATHTGKYQIILASYLLALIKKVLIMNLKFLLFPIYVSVTLIKSKSEIHPMNFRNPDILKFITKFLFIKCFKKFKICPSLTRFLKCKKRHPKMVDIIEFIWQFIHQNTYKKSLLGPSFTLCPSNVSKPLKIGCYLQIYLVVLIK